MYYRVHGILQARILEWVASLLQRIFPTQKLNPSPALQADSLPAEPQGEPKNTGVGSLSLLQGIFLTQELNGVSCIAGRFFTNWAVIEAHGPPLSPPLFPSFKFVSVSLPPHSRRPNNSPNHYYPNVHFPGEIWVRPASSSNGPPRSCPPCLLWFLLAVHSSRFPLGRAQRGSWILH